MKKLILSIALLSLTASLHAQSKKPVTKPVAKTEVEKPTEASRPAPTDVDLNIKLKGSEFNVLTQSALNGFLPWLKTTNTPMNAEEDAKKYFTGIYNNIMSQAKAQVIADSVAKAKLKVDTAKVKN